ncbi:MAG: SDR family oxidoreductase [Rickettsiales bacterium]|jgi:NAD(P)-dependent dehydrogenase (short-subunit alcohol dehydrogenase family)|nr:SDR family oxidoreductase [Rickettsiales bacterium]
MKNIVITGANRGIGLELAKIYAPNNNIFAICRRSSNEVEQIKNVTVIPNTDLTDSLAIESAISKCPKEIDLLINNAGILQKVEFIDIANSKDDITNQFQINALAPILVSYFCSKKLIPGSKIALISSRMGSINDNGSGSSYGYRMSKAALNAAGKSLAIDLKNKNISVGIIHPGWVRTEMTNHTGHIEANEAAMAMAQRIEKLNIENSGTFWHSNGEVLEW